MPAVRLRRAGRRTNLGLLVLLAGAFASGWVAFAVGSAPPAVVVALLHALFGVGVILLLPWKGVIIRRAARRRAASWVLVVLVLACLAGGLVQALVGYQTVVGLSPIQVHVGAALVGALLLGWHVLRHRPQRPGRVDLSRRALLRTAGFGGAAGVGTALLAGAAWVSRGAADRPAATGSRAVDPTAIPATIWLFDRVPLAPDPDAAAVQVGERDWPVAELRRRAVDVRARLDCTSGWFADATWSAVPVVELLGAVDPLARSLVVRSVTGYSRRFPIAAAHRLWLATACQGRDLTPEAGAPVRLVAQDHRGFWWVKWVASVEPSRLPAWRQLPFPVQ